MITQNSERLSKKKKDYGLFCHDESIAEGCWIWDSYIILLSYLHSAKYFYFFLLSVLGIFHLSLSCCYVNILALKCEPSSS